MTLTGVSEGSVSVAVPVIPSAEVMDLAAAEFALAPGPVVRGVRRLLGHDRVLTKLDPVQRAAYDERVRDQSR